MSIFLFFIVIVELVQYKHSQPCCIGKYKTDLENERERGQRERDGENDGVCTHTRAQAGPDFCSHL